MAPQQEKEASEEHSGSPSESQSEQNLSVESDDGFKYEEIEIESDDDDGDEVSEDLEAAIQSLQKLTAKSQVTQSAKQVQNNQDKLPAPGQVSTQPELVDDFIRNFLVKMDLNKTLQQFENEWYELKSQGKLPMEIGQVPDLYMHNLNLQDQVYGLSTQLIEAKDIAQRATSTWDQFRRERDFHRMHHKRVAQEKNRLIEEIKKLRAHYGKYEPTLKDLNRKHQAAIKEKVLMKIDRDKQLQHAEALENRLKDMTAQTMKLAGRSDIRQGQDLQKQQSQKQTKPGAQLQLPDMDKGNPFEGVEFDPQSVKGYTLLKTFKGHLLPVSSLSIHPSKPIAVTCSDDKTWRMWHLPQGELIMSGEGHKEWVSDVSFHPKGTCLASSSGDGAVKLWSFEKQKCIHTLSDHSKAVWGVDFHSVADILASCSLDQTVRIWDCQVAKCKSALRGHTDSINSLQWQPYTNNICTASSDKTVSVWDARTGLCSQTFYGHTSSVNHVQTSLRCNITASTDTEGTLKIWDNRMTQCVHTIQVSSYGANQCAFDRSGDVIAVACDDGRIVCFYSSSGEYSAELCGHVDAVQAVSFDMSGQYLVSGGADNTFRLWCDKQNANV